MNLLFKHRHLPLIFNSSAARTPGGANHRENSQGLQSCSRDKNTLGVRALVGGIDKKTFRRRLREIGRHETFEDLIILCLLYTSYEGQPYHLGQTL